MKNFTICSLSILLVILVSTNVLAESFSSENINQASGGTIEAAIFFTLAALIFAVKKYFEKKEKVADEKN